LRRRPIRATIGGVRIRAGTGPGVAPMTATSTLAAPAGPRHGAAIGLTLIAFVLFTGMDSCIKLLSGRYHTVHIACLNALFALLPLLAAAAWGGGLHRLRTRRLPLQALRGLCQASGVPLTFFAYSLMPLADAYALLFTMPLIITALSVPLLGEPVGARRWGAVVVGFLGVLIVLRPGSGLIGLGTIAALSGALMNAFAMMILRQVGATDNTEAAAFYGNLVFLIVMALALPFVLILPAPEDLALSALGGTFGGTAYLLLAHAYKRAPAALVAPFQYAQMPFALVAGYLLFGNRPQPMMLIGAAVVIASGLYILHRETVRRADA
jgi:drug/metabolite transporter (DMT)-like permease